MKRLKSLFLILIFSITALLVGCSKSVSTSSNPSNEKKTITVKDSTGNSVTVPLEPKRVVVMNNSVAEIIQVLGEEDKIVGVSDKLNFPESLAKKNKVGAAFTPNIEKILELKPDLVFGYGKYIKKDALEKLKTSGVKFISIDAYKIDSLEKDIKTIGEIFNKKDKANEYISFINKNLNKIKDKVSTLKEEQKVKVYWEGYSDYKTVAKGAGGTEVLNMAGVKNIAENEPVEYPQVSGEWLITQNPKIIVKQAKTTKLIGYEADNTNGIKKDKDKLFQRSGWDKIDAVKNENTYIMSNEIATSARSIIGICYLAKWAYPELFKDLNPEEIHKEMLEKFYKVKYKGIWVFK